MTRMQRICTDSFRKIRVDPAQSVSSVSHSYDGYIGFDAKNPRRFCTAGLRQDR